MKPKLWDGPDAVGESKVRQLAQVDAPYLSAAGPGFVAATKGGFSEVFRTGTPVPVAGEGWLSASSGGAAEVVLAATSTLYAPFKRRGAVSQADPGMAMGSNLTPDGRGGALASAFVSEDTVWRTYTDVRIRHGGRSAIPLADYVLFKHHAAAVSLVPYGQLLGTGTQSGQGGGMRWGISAATSWHMDGEVVRSHPMLIYTVPNEGSWVAGYLDLPYAQTDDTDVPVLCVHSQLRLSALWARGPKLPPKLYYSNDFGGSWSGGIDVSGILVGLDADRGVTPFTEQHYIALGYSKQNARTLCLQQVQIQRRMVAGRGLAGFAGFEVTLNKLCVYTPAPYWNGTAHVVAVALLDVRYGVVRRAAWEIAETDYIDVRPLGKLAWMVTCRRTDAGSIDGVVAVWTRVTFDGGQTYQTLTLPSHALPGGVWIVTPFESFSAPMKFIVLGTDPVTRDRIAYLTADLSEFKQVGTVAKHAWFSPGVPERNFNKVIYTGTPEQPGDMNPYVPWVYDDRVPTPDWWNEL